MSCLDGEVCVVTGACGFLGKTLIRMLLEQEKNLREIRLLDIDIKQELLQSLEECRGDIKLSAFEGDIRDAEFVRTACRGATLIFHIASLIDVIDAVAPSEMYSVNVKGTQNLLEASIQENVPSFIYTSTVEVMGPNPEGEPVVNGHEDMAYQSSLKFSYSKTKKEAEDRTLGCNGERLRNGGRMATCALRPMYIYGEDCRFLLNHMADGVRNGGVLYRMSMREAKVNPVYVGNVAAAHLQAARSLKDPERRADVGGKFYFVSDDTPHVSYSDFNYAVMSPLGFSIQDKMTVPLRLFYVVCFLWEMACLILRPFRRVVPPINRHLLTMLNTPFSFSYDKAKCELGYVPKYTWQQARSNTTQWLAQQLPKQREKIWKK
ncbi:hydroxy-delta-5-steroid dehydrogenase, 3 beta- and steroid delta-isomerase 1 [Syngnathoides biaculeatus]|uniref:hydroxy-delta-5-steroid dehydrogenase, 3 beta- and steroid delta-isomerase 1 n=1 Tax=Syngnathoides biaculeatus TaxID=300417 RepID=UPI002ADE4810|nr:hydroxy-delta-5-steroid dehydrogenase, 3 beta- and steroid delta-isomerase 1 [Syngnathoides biaculeatus]